MTNETLVAEENAPIGVVPDMANIGISLETMTAANTDAKGMSKASQGDTQEDRLSRTLKKVHAQYGDVLRRLAE